MEWKYIKMTEFCYNVTDGTHDSPKRQDSGRYLITSKHIKSRSIDYDSAYFISEDDYQKIIKRSRVDQWDVIISMIGAYCGFCYIEESTKTEYAVKNVGLLKVGTEIDAKWLYYYLNSPEGKSKLLSCRAGSTQPYISLGSLRDFSVKIPVNNNYKVKTVGILSSLDAKIENNNKINAKLEEMAQALFKSWFIDFEPFKVGRDGSRPAFGSGNFVESELGLIPEGWKVGKLGSIAENITDGVHNTVIDDPNSKYLLLSAKNIKSGKLEISSSERTISKETFAKLRTRTKLSKGDVLLTSVGTIGELYLVNEDPSNIEFQRSVIIIKPGVLLSPYFVYLLLKSQLAELKNMAHGAVQQCIFIGDMKDLKIVIPPVDIIVKFGSVVSTFFDKITKNNKESSNLAQTRDTLLPKLMSGEIEL